MKPIDIALAHDTCYPALIKVALRKGLSDSVSRLSEENQKRYDEYAKDPAGDLIDALVVAATEVRREVRDLCDDIELYRKALGELEILVAKAQIGSSAIALTKQIMAPQLNRLDGLEEMANLNALMSIG
jgi:hypothetical protein